VADEDGGFRGGGGTRSGGDGGRNDFPRVAVTRKASGGQNLQSPANTYKL
jgi:hypothetical protein